ncbi:uncharacterized protein LOC119164558 isoform X3 [Rhipicephalus microplus]|uniref:uncharacterized protein LOC119164558 isoform X3 n=1 Tax=Rhipicephalus microplus TaxID=6941 RepID=UPI003F6A943C
MVHEMGHLPPLFGSSERNADSRGSAPLPVSPPETMPPRFGSYHDGDNTSVSCPAELGYIMSPTSHEKHKDHFSTCSKAAIAKYVRSDAGGCLRSAASQRPIGINPWRYKRSRRRKRPDHDVTTAF